MFKKYFLTLGLLGSSVIGLAQEKKMENILKESSGAKESIYPVPQLTVKETLLIQAINLGDKNQLEELIKEGVDINHVFKLPIPIGPDKGKIIELTPLALALSLNNKKMVTFLLNSGASLEQKFKNLDGKELTAREYLQYTLDKTIKNTQEMLALLDAQTAKSKKA